MTTISTQTIAFVPQATSIFQQQVSLDGSQYTLTILWSLFGARYYVQITDQTGVLVVYRPLIGSPLGYNLSAVTSANNIVTVTTSTPHTFVVGSVVPLTISGCVPDAYNGLFDCNITSHIQFTYSLATASNGASGVGQVNYYMSMTAGYFDSDLVYYPDNNQIVIYG